MKQKQQWTRMILPLIISIGGAVACASIEDTSGKGGKNVWIEQAKTGASPVQTVNLVSEVSAFDVETTLARLQSAIDARAFKTFAVIDHAKGAASIGEDLRPTTLVIFGNPKGGTPLMQSSQTMGLALPLKMLVYQAEDGSVIVSWEDMASVLASHGVNDREALLGKIEGALAAIAREATIEVEQ